MNFVESKQKEEHNITSQRKEKEAICKLYIEHTSQYIPPRTHKKKKTTINKSVPTIKKPVHGGTD